MAKTSINIQPIKGGSELHNNREKELDYVRPDLSHENEKWISHSVSEKLEFIKQNTKKKTRRALQKKATPIREGVIVLSEKTELKDLQNFAQKAEDKFGIKAFQIYIHKDEGHYKDQEQKEWKPNLHAHIVFDWTDHNSGKSIKLNRQDMAQMQTILAETLGMERGISSEREHLEALQFKNEAEFSRLEKLLEEKQNNLRKAEKELKNAKLKATTAKTTSRVLGKVYELLGATKGEKKITELEKEKQILHKDNQELQAQVRGSNQAVLIYRESSQRAEDKLKNLQINYNELRKTTDVLNDFINKNSKKVYEEVISLVQDNKLSKKDLENTGILDMANIGLSVKQEEERQELAKKQELDKKQTLNRNRGRGISF